MSNVGRIQAMMLIAVCVLPLLRVEADEDSTSPGLKVLVGHWEGKVQDPNGSYYPCSFDFWFEEDEIVAFQGSLLGTGRFDRVWIQNDFIMAERLDTLYGRLYLKAKLRQDKVLEFEYGLGQGAQETRLGSGEVKQIDSESQEFIDAAVLSGTYRAGSASTPRVELELQINVKGEDLTGKIIMSTATLDIVQGNRRHNQIFLECASHDGTKGWIVGTIRKDGELWIFWRIGNASGRAEMSSEAKAS